MSDQTYLAKDGKTFGPYDAKTVESLKNSGEFYTYEWVWDGASPNWAPVPRKVKGPPPLPSGDASPRISNADVVKGTASSTPSAQRELGKSLTRKTYCAIAFDSRTTISVDVKNIHETGGELISTQSGSQAFPKGSMIWIDLLDEETDQASKMKAKIEGTSNQSGKWHYQVSWSKFPFA